MNWGRDAEARNMTLFGKLADGKDGGLMSQNNHLIGVWVWVLLQIRDGEVKETKRSLLLQICPRMVSLRVHFSSVA